ncbi:MAG: hypothetical protein WCT31_05515 [Candidatus Micrarchaeia archaeon]|jgi:hypothetical protein
MVTASAGVFGFINGIVGGIGSLLFLIGFFGAAAGDGSTLLAIGVFLYVASEAVTLYLAKYDGVKQREIFVATFWNSLGLNFALPALLFALYFVNQSKFTLLFTIALLAQAVIKTVSMVIRMKYIEESSGTN